MRCRHRACDQRIDSAQTRCTDRQRHLLHQLLSFLRPAFQFETQDAAKTVKQLTSTDVAWVAFKAGIVDRLHCRMTFEELRYRERAFVLISDTKSKGLHAAVK